MLKETPKDILDEIELAILRNLRRVLEHNMVHASTVDQWVEVYIKLKKTRQGIYDGRWRTGKLNNTNTI